MIGYLDLMFVFDSCVCYGRVGCGMRCCVGCIVLGVLFVCLFIW